MRYEELLPDLRRFYDQDVERRDQAPKTDWKIQERQRFLERLQAESKRRLLEIGAGTGQDSQFFQDNGLDVTCTDLSPAMVERCRSKGLRAYVMDFLHLDFPAASFDAVFARNCLLHVPRSDLARVLALIQALLKPDGLFCLGVYGGADKEGVFSDGSEQEKRFFCYYSNERLLEAISPWFEIESFQIIQLQESSRDCYQSLLLRQKSHSS